MMPASRERWLLLVLLPALVFPVVYLSVAQPRPRVARAPQGEVVGGRAVRHGQGSAS